MTDTTNFPGCEDEFVSIPARLQLHEDLTVTISFLEVPILDVDDLIMTLATDQGRMDLQIHLAELLADMIERRKADGPIPFEVVPFGV